MKRLEGKYALITGGTAGIGLETARQFLQEGAHVAVTGRNKVGLRSVFNELEGKVLTIKSDAGALADQAKLATQLSKTFPKLDILYINAGDVTHKPLEEWDESSFEQVMSTNLKGPFFLIQALLPILSYSASIIIFGSG
jgi:NAD(P)-dependent dehydrogenase (short-subunit alcohol dehydrogenase family)